MVYLAGGTSKKEIDEYPKKWFENAKISADGFNQELNYFGGDCRSKHVCLVRKRMDYS